METECTCNWRKEPDCPVHYPVANPFGEAAIDKEIARIKEHISDEGKPIPFQPRYEGQ